MKIFLFTIVFYFFAVGFVSGQSLKRDEKLEQEIRKLDLAHAEAILKRDVDALNKLLAREVVTNHPTNKVVNERDGIFELIRNGTINYSSFETSSRNLPVLQKYGHRDGTRNARYGKRRQNRQPPLHEHLDETKRQMAFEHQTRAHRLF